MKPKLGPFRQDTRITGVLPRGSRGLALRRRYDIYDQQEKDLKRDSKK
jgi:hypothetical protein